MKLKAVCFDMDGVTIDTEPLYAKAEIRLFREYGVEIPDEDWKLFRGCNEETFYELSMTRYGVKENREKFMKKGRMYVREEFEIHLDFMDGFLELQKDIFSKGLSTALVTASPQAMFNFVDSRLKLTSIFKTVIYGGMTKDQKPHPAPYLLAMDRLNSSPNETVIIEDSVHGLQSAKDSGAVVIGIRGSIPEENLSIAHHIVSRLSELNVQSLTEIHETYHL